MSQNLLEKTKSYINTINPYEVMTLFEYFDNSPEFTLYSEKRGLEIPLNTDSVTYVDGEMDDRNCYKEYIANDGGFIIRVDKYCIREGKWKSLHDSKNKLSLEKVENTESKTPIYRVTCK